MAGLAGGDPPGILGLVELIDEHRGAFEFDWRTRFGLPLADVPGRMSWGEAWRLTRELSVEPDSHVASALAGWQYPSSRAALVLADLFDLHHTIHAKQSPKPYPRPWDAAPRTIRPTVSQARVRELLRSAGHDM